MTRTRAIALARKLSARAADPSSSTGERAVATRRLRELVAEHGLTEEEAAPIETATLRLSWWRLLVMEAWIVRRRWAGSARVSWANRSAVLHGPAASVVAGELQNRWRQMEGAAAEWDRRRVDLGMAQLLIADMASGSSTTVDDWLATASHEMFRRTLRWKADTMVAEARAVLDAPPPAPAAEPPRALLTGPVRDLVAEALAAEEARAVDVEAAAPAPEPPETPAPERTYWPVPEAVAWVRANA